MLEIIQEQKHLDAEYIYHKLHYYRAFYYVMAPQPYLIAQTRRSKVDDGLRREIPAEPSKLMLALFTFLFKIMELSQIYRCQVKI